MTRALLGLLLLAPSAVFAVDPAVQISQYGHTMWTLQNGGLPGAPTDIAQTTDGYLWIGTRAGLVRFDGVHFIPFAPPHGEELPSTRILSLRAASDGSLWIGTRSGLGRWHRGHLTLYDSGAVSILSILEDRGGKIWFTRGRIRDGKGALCEVSRDDVLCHDANDGVPLPAAQQLAQDAQGNLWTVSPFALLQWRPGSSRLYPLSTLSQSDRRGTMDVLKTVAVAADGTVWVGATRSSRGHGLMRLVDGKLQPYVTPEIDGRKLMVWTLLADREDALWVGTEDGLYRLYKNKVSHFGMHDGLASDSVNRVFEDREGTLWVLTSAGVNAFRNLRVMSVTSREGLSGELANAVLAARDGTVYIESFDSLDVLRNGKLTSLNARTGLPGGQISSLFEDRSGTLWVGVDRDLFVKEAGKLRPFRRVDGSSMGAVRAMTQDTAGDLWALISSSTPATTLTHIHDGRVVEDIPQSKIPFAATLSIAADRQAGIWLPLQNGDLARYRRGNLQIVAFHRKPGIGQITGLISNSDGSVIGSTTHGLIGWHEGRSRIMSLDHGLPCREIHALLSDTQGALWLYASCGVIFVANDQVQAWWQDSTARLQFQLYDTLDGAQPARAINFPRASLAPDGKLWFVNSSIVQVIDPKRLSINRLPPPVRIETLIADHQTFTSFSGLRLTPPVRDIQIDYTALSFVLPQKNQFRYTLEGHDSHWQAAGSRRQAFYTDLPPGRYRFRVIASNNDGVWNNTSAAIDFEIPPAYYQTLWFRLLCLAVLAALVWLLIALRVRVVTGYIRARIEERVGERERIARELHDTLLQGFHGLMLRLQVTLRQIPEKESAHQMLADALDRADALLKESRERISNLRRENPDAATLPMVLARLAEELSKDSAMAIAVTVDGPLHALNPVIQEEMVLIAREALSNTFRHSRGTQVEVELDFRGLAIRLCVRDNGQGIPPDVLRAGGLEGHWGLTGMRERTEKIGGQLRIWNREGQGTEVELHVPATIAYDTAIMRRPLWRRLLNMDLSASLRDS